MSVRRAEVLLLISVLAVSWTARAEEIEPRVGGFFQAGGGFLGSGGLFVSPLSTRPAMLGMRIFGGAWLLKDKGGTPAAAPTLECEGLWTSSGGTGPWHLGLTAGLGFALVLDAPYGVVGVRLGHDFGERGLPLLGAAALALQSQLLISPQGATFIGVAFDWRW